MLPERASPLFRHNFPHTSIERTESPNMPTYDYQCEACGHSMELFQGINDPVEKKCPECKKNKLVRQFGTGAAIMFKGSGFYQTDYRSEGYKKAAKADKNSSSESGSSKSDSSTKGDSSPKSEKKNDSSGGKSEAKPSAPKPKSE